MSLADKLIERIEKAQITVAVIGLGYVGLPLALRLAQRGCTVLGVDLDSSRVAAINRGISPFPDLESRELEAVVRKEKLKASCNHGVIKSAHVVIVDVPTPLSKTREPDVSMVMGALEQVFEHLAQGQLVVIESTTYPAFTREIAAPLLEKSGLKVGEDFFLAFSPERIDPGNDTFGVANTPKIVGGISPLCARVAQAFFGLVTPLVRQVSSTDAAEMVKLHENTFRAVNIALANETLMISRRLGLDPWEIIDAAATKPFGFMPFYPGPGLGGHCIPVDPIYLSWKLKSLDYSVRFIELADALNSSMPQYTVQRLGDMLNRHKLCINGSKILVMGVAYKADVADMRESPALKIIELLKAKGADVSFSDPFVPVLSLSDQSQLDSQDWEIQAPLATLVLILTSHTGLDYQRLVGLSSMVLDTRGTTRFLNLDEKVERL